MMPFGFRKCLPQMSFSPFHMGAVWWVLESLIEFLSRVDGAVARKKLGSALFSWSPPLLFYIAAFVFFSCASVVLAPPALHF